MADFKKDKYEIIKKAIPKVLSEFAYNYMLIKKQVAATMFYSNFLHKDQTEWGTFRDPQVLLKSFKKLVIFSGFNPRIHAFKIL